MKDFTIKDESLRAVLDSADADDLAVLVDYITDAGRGRLSLSDDNCDTLLEARESGRFTPRVRHLIAKEISLFGGNSVFNIIRGDGVPYTEICRDVADHLHAPYSKNDTVEDVEASIIAKLIEKSFSEMSEEQKEEMASGLGIPKGALGLMALLTAMKAGGFATYRLTLIAANAMARALLGRGLALGVNAALARTVSLLAGPIGWAISLLWTAFDLAGPAYRVTVPCVIQIAWLRQKQNARLCGKCKTPNSKAAHFCSECGTKL